MAPERGGLAQIWIDPRCRAPSFVDPSKTSCSHCGKPFSGLKLVFPAVRRQVTCDNAAVCIGRPLKRWPQLAPMAQNQHNRWRSQGPLGGWVVSEAGRAVWVSTRLRNQRAWTRSPRRPGPSLRKAAKVTAGSPLEAVLGKTHRPEFQRGQRKRMDGLMTICHEARKGGPIGSHWPTHGAPLLYSTWKDSVVRPGTGFRALLPCTTKVIYLN
jgi:hypothetical protein